MKRSKWFKLLMLCFMIASFTAIGCDKDDAGDGDDNDSTAAENTTDDNAGEGAGDIKSAMVGMSKNMYDLIDDVEDEADVDEIDSKIGEIFDDLVEELRGAITDPAAMQQMQTMQNDPEVKEWSDKLTAKMDELKKNNPAAATKLEQVVMKHSAKMMTLMTEAAQKMQQDMQNAAPGGTTGDSTDAGASDTNASH